jgi:hypothetical protein
MASCNRGSSLFNLVCCLVSAILLPFAGLLAEDERQITLAEHMPFLGEVVQVIMVTKSGESSPKSVAATWIPSKDSEDELVCIGRVPAVPEAGERLQVISLVLGTQGEVKSAYREITAEELSPSLMLSSAELRDRFVERRGILRQLQNEVDAQTSRLRDLQQDADNIAMVSKIVDAEDELGELKERLTRVSLAQSDLDRRVNQMRSRPQPLNAKKREAELVDQLSQLSTALSATENQAIKKISGAKGALEEKLRFIEETRDEHIALLEEELARVKRGRLVKP